MNCKLLFFSNSKTKTNKNFKNNVRFKNMLKILCLPVLRFKNVMLKMIKGKVIIGAYYTSLLGRLKVVRPRLTHEKVPLDEDNAQTRNSNGKWDSNWFLIDPIYLDLALCDFFLFFYLKI